MNYDTRWKEKFDCILANPPFMTPSGGINPHDKFRIRANRTEILFADYILEHLTPNGKAGFVVPEGIIFQGSGDFTELRKWILYEAGLWAVVSLPSQIFQPYSGVKTSILLIDREVARTRSEILLVKIENDGFSLNTNRAPIKENDLPDALHWLDMCKKNWNISKLK
ncbi:MAG: N-6 DNA methylase [Chitinophagaceae bacterium]